MPTPRYGLALSGGATKGMATLAILEQLLQSSAPPIGAVAGTSVGAIVGAYFALHGEVTTLRERVLGISLRDWLRLADVTLRPTRSMVAAKGYATLLRDIFGDATFADTSIPLAITTTNLHRGQSQTLTTGSLVDALLASTAFPGVLPPVQRDGDLFVDGGVLQNLPIPAVESLGAERIIAINLEGARERSTDTFGNVLSVVGRVIELMIDNAFHRLYAESDQLFVFDAQFPPTMTSLWNVRDLPQKYDRGLATWHDRATDFQQWCTRPTA